MILLQILPKEGLDILWELKVAGVFIFCLLTAVVTIFSLLIRSLNKQMTSISKKLEEKDAQIIELHNKSEDNLKTVTAALTETTNQLADCANILKEFSEKSAVLSQRIDKSVGVVTALSKRLK